MELIVDVASYATFQRTVRTAAGEIGCADVGDGPPALFVHGFFLSGFFWSGVMAQVADLRRCIAVDLPAHGTTDVAADVPLALESQADVLVGLCDELGLDTVDLVGNDSGGAIAQLFAARHPGRVRSLTLTNCDVQDNCPPPAFNDIAMEILQTGVETVMRRGLDDMAFVRSDQGLGVGWRDPTLLSREAVEQFYAPVLARPGGPKELERWMLEFNGDALVNHEAQLRRLTCPALLVWGTGDQFFPMATAQWLRDALPGATEIVEVPDAKLYFPQETPAALAEPLRAFWQQTTTTA